MTFESQNDSGADTWFLAQLKPNSLQIAERNLHRQGFTTFTPMLEETRQRRGKFVRAATPMFPGYTFVAKDETARWWRAINSTYGVSRLVSFGGAPTPVPGDLVSQIMIRCDASGTVRPLSELSEGDQVQLTTGPFAGFAAEVERIDPDRRIWVLLDIMGGQRRVVTDAGDVRRV